MDREQVALVRRFNRRVTRSIGILQDRYLGRDRPLAEARLLYEIGSTGAEALALRDRLGLDSGYLSRLLRSLEDQGLVTTEPSPRDRRIRIVRLTGDGLAELEAIDRGADDLVLTLLDPLSTPQKARLMQAMIEVDRLLTAASIRFETVSPSSADANHCLSRYFAELEQRFDGGFDSSLSLAPNHDEFQAPSGAFLVMRLDGEPVGCGGFRFEGPDAAYVKRMWIDSGLRGLGLGRRLLEEIEAKARGLGHARIVLETERSLTEARQLYLSSGYREIEPFNAERYAHHWFEKRLN